MPEKGGPNMCYVFLFLIDYFHDQGEYVLEELTYLLAFDYGCTPTGGG
jgi:hypothetical protein